MRIRRALREAPAKAGRMRGKPRISPRFARVMRATCWSVDQISKLAAVPWSDWPIIKVILLVIVVVAVVWSLYRVLWELWLSAERVLSAFAGLLVVFVHTPPRVLLAGVLALGGVCVMNHLDNSMMRIPMSLQVWLQKAQQPQPEPQARPQ
jgi:hypothetical protein